MVNSRVKKRSRKAYRPYCVIGSIIALEQDTLILETNNGFIELFGDYMMCQFNSKKDCLISYIIKKPFK